MRELRNSKAPHSVAWYAMKMTTTITRSALILTLLIAAGCNHKSESTASAEPVPAQTRSTSTASYLDAKLATFTVTPATVAAGQKATLAGKLTDAPDGMPVTASIFGPDGRLVDDFDGEVRGGAFSIAVPDDISKKPGNYLADLRTGLLHLGTANFTVTG